MPADWMDKVERWMAEQLAPPVNVKVPAPRPVAVPKPATAGPLPEPATVEEFAALPDDVMRAVFVARRGSPAGVAEMTRGEIVSAWKYLSQFKRIGK